MSVKTSGRRTMAVNVNYPIMTRTQSSSLGLYMMHWSSWKTQPLQSAHFWRASLPPLHIAHSTETGKKPKKVCDLTANWMERLMWLRNTTIFCTLFWPQISSQVGQSPALWSNTEERVVLTREQLARDNSWQREQTSGCGFRLWFVTDSCYKNF